MKSKVFTGIFLVISICGYAQSYKYLDSLDIEFQISSYASDPFGNLYLGSSNGEILVVDSSATPDRSFFLSNRGSVHSISAWNPLRLFIFSREIQSFWFLERFSVDPRIYTTNKFSDSFVLEMTPGQDHSFWLIETTGSSLKKINETTRQYIFEQPLINLNVGMPVVFKSYKNLLIILDESSMITLLDPFGNVVDRIQGEEITAVQVWEDQLHYIDSEKLIIRDIYKKTPGKSMELPGNFKKFQRISPSLFYFIETKKIKLYRYMDL